MTVNPNSGTNSSDVLFRRMIVVSTALSLAAIYGWLASFDRQPNGDINFRWQWYALWWVLIGVASCLYFWRQVWPPEPLPPATRKAVIKGSVALIVPGLWWLIFPLRFLSGQHFWDVAIGLIAATCVLSFGAWMVIKLIMAIERTDQADLAALNQSGPSQSIPSPGTKTPGEK